MAELFELSRPVRGAWIETVGYYIGVRKGNRRAPCGARGLKPATAASALWDEASRPVRGAWIETAYQRRMHRAWAVAPRAGRVD